MDNSVILFKNKELTSVINLYSLLLLMKERKILKKVNKDNLYMSIINQFKDLDSYIVKNIQNKLHLKTLFINKINEILLDFEDTILTVKDAKECLSILYKYFVLFSLSEKLKLKELPDNIDKLIDGYIKAFEKDLEYMIDIYDKKLLEEGYCFDKRKYISILIHKNEYVLIASHS